MTRKAKKNPDQVVPTQQLKRVEAIRVTRTAGKRMPGNFNYSTQGDDDETSIDDTE